MVYKNLYFELGVSSFYNTLDIDVQIDRQTNRQTNI